jgi:hypothetical protein
MATFMNESIIIGSDRSTPRGPWPGVTLVLALGALAAASWALYGEEPTPTPIVVAPLSTTTPVTAPAPIVTSVKLAFLDASGEGKGKPAGCDTVELVELPVPPTADPVGASLAALFGVATSTDLAPGNFVGDQDGLSFLRAEAHEDDVHVYLKGSVSYAGVCDDPRLKFQIEETVRANAAAPIDEVEFFLNDEIYAAPDERGAVEPEPAE